MSSTASIGQRARSPSSASATSSKATPTSYPCIRRGLRTSSPLRVQPSRSIRYALSVASPRPSPCSTTAMPRGSRPLYVVLTSCWRKASASRLCSCPMARIPTPSHAATAIPSYKPIWMSTRRTSSTSRSTSITRRWSGIPCAELS